MVQGNGILPSSRITYRFRKWLAERCSYAAHSASLVPIVVQYERKIAEWSPVVQLYLTYWITKLKRERRKRWLLGE